MAEPVPEEQADDEPSVIPPWVPVVVGVLLVAMAGLAVYTGLRLRDDGTFARHVRPRTDRPQTPAPPGEPGAGASLVLHGESGENTPAAHEPVSGEARAVITGDTGGVQSTLRIWARRGVVFNVLPEDAMVYVNELPIGQVRQFNTMDEVYDFAEAGSYTVKVVAPSGVAKTYVVTAAEDAPQDIARISGKLE